MKKLLLLGLSTFAISAHAWQPTYYVGSGLSAWQFKQSDIGHNFTISTVEGLIGVELTPYTSIEGRLGGGLNTAREWITLPGDAEQTEVEVEAKYFGSLYFKPHLKNEKASLYGLLGVTTIDLEANTGPSDDTHTDMSYGIGVSFVMSPNVDLTAEWKKLINAEEFDMRGGTIGFVYKF